MTKTFIQTNEFSKNWEELGFNDEDLRNNIKKMIQLLEVSLKEEGN